ncbi:MAG TPA: hypothetical protein ENJ09_09795 [Planctomycetes bacterium]|nr:hypothetical protein [Planctomycetota bacterium]
MYATLSPLLVAASILGLGAASSAQDGPDDWVVEADMIYTAAGDPIEDGRVVVSDGKIAALGGSGSGDTLRVTAVTPGFVDLGISIDTGALSVEQTTETAITSRVADSLDLFSYRWTRALRHGVTTALASPADYDVIGGLCTVLKTGGGSDLASREVKADACLRASLGPQPSTGNRTPSPFGEVSIYTRRPTTRMGVEWVFRKAYYDALNAKRFGLEATPEQEAGFEVLAKTLRGELPVIVRTVATQDVHTAAFLKQEFGIPRMILADAAEAWKEADLVKACGAAVLLPPAPREGRVKDRFANDTYLFALDAAARFHELGVPIALTGHATADPEATLARQAGLAMRGGLPFEAALEAVTIAPARMVGVDDRVGSIEVGKDADLVLWNGTPFELTSRVVGVILDGHLVLDPRAASGDDE